MNRTHLFRSAILVTTASLALFLSGCGNMKKQRNVRPFDPSAHFRDGTSARLAPSGTVARGVSERPNAKIFDQNELESVASLPVPLTKELLLRGRERFEIYCAVCHGADGYGSGIVVRRGFPAPPSLHDERLRQVNLGHFVNVITHGYGTMYAYGDRVTEGDRWAIAAYIRVLQRSQHATLADVPADQLAKLNTP